MGRRNRIGVRPPICRTLVILFAATALHAGQPKEFRNWPAGTSPVEVGTRVSERFLSTVKLSEETPLYPAMCTWYGALTFAQLTNNKTLLQQLIIKFDQQFTPALANFVLAKHHVDYSVSGAIPLQIAIATNDHRQFIKGLTFADHQWESPTPDGISHETRYWIDDMYMITILQVQAYRATGDKQYLDRAAQEMTAYLDKLQQPNGLFYHAPDVPFFWGRGDGWVAAGMTEMLRDLPADHPRRARILAGYKLMMAALLKYQGPDGMWRQLIDHDEAWEESSSSGMFTFALITGVKNGWLDAATYGPAARKAWIAVTGFIDQNSDVTSICEGTNKFNSLDYYLQRKRRTGDFHGQEPVLWAASALLR